MNVLEIPLPTTVPISLYNEGVVVRRVVNADNNCLFNCVGYTLYHTRHLSVQLRELIAKQIANNPYKYTDVFLGKPSLEYRQWIQKLETWGGAIECAIFSDVFQTEIACCDIQTLRVDVYGQGKSFKQRVYFIYDGIHYDPLALTFSSDLPEDCDVTLFNPDDSYIYQQALKIAKEMNAKKKFTDTSKYSLVCLVCRQGLTGNADAASHAQKTGHVNFAQNQ